jgi:mono/diheme cytochrome c family protein
MREQWARNIALLTVVLVVLLAVMFAKIQNPSEPRPSAVEEAASSSSPPVILSESDKEKQALIAAGRRIFEAQGCMRCHSIAGEGSTRNPLDGVGERHTAEAIRQWIIAPAELKDQLSARAFQVKQAYHSLPPEDLDALVAYLQSLRPAAAMQRPAQPLPTDEKGQSAKTPH